MNGLSSYQRRGNRLKKTLLLMAVLATIASPAASQVRNALQINTTGNGIWEPGELVDLRPAWRNTTAAP